MIRLGLRRAALATLLILAGCDSPPPVGSAHAALVAGCNVDADCIAAYGSTLGASATVTCNQTTHVCDVVTTTACAGDGDCDDNNPCTIDTCTGTVCANTPTIGLGCCLTAATCLGANGCQTAVCSDSECGFVAKSGGTGCCNVGSDCAGTATCTANTCSCPAGKTYCPTVGCVSGSACCVNADCSGGNVCSDGSCVCPAGDKSCGATCVPTSGCCSAAECTVGNGCQSATCSSAGVCGVTSSGGAGCCNGNTDCGGGSTCDTASNRCVCGGGQKLCAGATPGADVCTSGCCTASDCAAIPNGTVTCDTSTHTCVAGSCDATFHICSGACVSNGSVNSCGATSCTACPAGDSCQTPACNASTSCGFVASGPSPCCNTLTDCVAANSCQVPSACNATTNRCKFTGKTGVSGCCTTATDCALPSDACLERTCVANQCGTAPISGCTDDGGIAPDMLSPRDMAAHDASVDLSVPDLALPGADLGKSTTPDLAGLSLSGGGGCAVAGHDAAPPWAALALALALALSAFARRRRTQ